MNPSFGKRKNSLLKLHPRFDLQNVNDLWIMPFFCNTRNKDFVVFVKHILFIGIKSKNSSKIHSKPNMLYKHCNFVKFISLFPENTGNLWQTILPFSLSYIRSNFIEKPLIRLNAFNRYKPSNYYILVFMLWLRSSFDKAKMCAL